MQTLEVADHTYCFQPRLRTPDPRECFLFRLSSAQRMICRLKSLGSVAVSISGAVEMWKGHGEVSQKMAFACRGLPGILLKP